MKAPLPGNEPERLRVLHSLAIVVTDPEQAYDDLCSLASQICGTPISFISFVDQDRQWYKSRFGSTATETSRDIAFCAHAILMPQLMIVNDATVDDRFADNPLVTEAPGIRFYAGAPLILSDGLAIGTLCVLDRVPRSLTEEQQEALRILRDQVVRLLELRKNEAELKRSFAAQEKVQQKLHETERRFFQFLDAVPVGVFVIDKDGNPFYANQEAQKLLGKGIVSRAGAEELADTYRAYVAGSQQEYPASRMPIVRALSGERSMVVDMEIHRGKTVVPVQVWGAPIFDDEGNVVFAIAAFSDLVDRRRTERRLSVVCAVGQVLSESTQLSEAGPRIVQSVCEAMRWEVGVLWEIDRKESVLSCVNVWHVPSSPVPEFEAMTRQFHYPSGLGLPGRVWATGKPAWIKDVGADNNFPRLPAALKNNLHGAVAFPLLTGGEVTGVIEFFSHEIEEPDEELLATLGSLDAQVGQFMARKSMEKEFARLSNPA